MDAEGVGGIGDALLVTREGLLNVQLFELLQSFGEPDVPIQHFFDHSFQTGAYLHWIFLPFKTKDFRRQVIDRLPGNDQSWLGLLREVERAEAAVCSNQDLRDSRARIACRTKAATYRHGNCRPATSAKNRVSGLPRSE